MTVVGEDDQERIFILCSWIKHCTTDEAVDQFFKHQQFWTPAIFGIDSSGTQILFAQQLMKEARTRQIQVPLRPMSLHADKIFQIEHTLQPIAAAGRLFRPPLNLCKELHGEWSNFPSDERMDGLDSLACAVRLLPSASTPLLKLQSEDQYRRHLQRSGYSEDDIRAKLALR